jgi:hypothetical protein
MLSSPISTGTTRAYDPPESGQPSTATIEDTSVHDYIVLRELLTTILEEHLKGPVPRAYAIEDRRRGLTDSHWRWLMLLDLCAAPEALRMGVQKRAPDATLVTLLRFFVRLGRDVDHDRFD